MSTFTPAHRIGPATEVHVCRTDHVDTAGAKARLGAAAHADRVGGIAVGLKTTTPEVFASQEAWMSGEPAVAVYQVA